MKKMITVVIPVFNSEKYISRCLDSILNQTFDNYQILLIDDGSTDNSQSIIKSYQTKNPELINYIYQQNQGVASTRNTAIKLTKTKYIVFIDNDDYIDNDYLENLYNTIELSKADIVLSGFRRVDSNNKILNNTILPGNDWSKLMIMTPWARIFRTDYLKQKRIMFLDNNIGEDIYLNLIALFETKKVEIIEYVGYNWFYNIESVSNTKQRDYGKINVYKLLNSSYDELNKRDLLKENYEIIEAFFTSYIYWFLLYVTPNMKYKEMSKEYNQLFKWLGLKFPNYKKNKYFGFNKPVGEISSKKRNYFLFHYSNKLHIGKVFVLFYNLLRKLLKR